MLERLILKIKAKPKYLYMVLLSLLMTPSFFGCRINEFHYTDWESHLVEKGYERSIAEIDGIYGHGTISVTLKYQFMIGDILMEQRKDLGNHGGYYVFQLYNGSKFEILYNPKNPKINTILLNKPFFDDNVQFEKAGAKIEFIAWRNFRSFLYNGFIEVGCRYSVRGISYLIRANVPKDLFFPNKDYSEITRKDFRKLNKMYKGKYCSVEYDVNNPGASRLIVDSILKNE